METDPCFWPVPITVSWLLCLAGIRKLESYFSRSFWLFSISSIRHHNSLLLNTSTCIYYKNKGIFFHRYKEISNLVTTILYYYQIYAHIQMTPTILMMHSTGIFFSSRIRSKIMHWILLLYLFILTCSSVLLWLFVVLLIFEDYLNLLHRISFNLSFNPNLINFLMIKVLHIW